ncbi:MAG: hypothetical protein AAF756_02240 [Pseudomonadota bacterium]
MSDAVERLLVRIDATSEQLRRELKAADRAVESVDRSIGKSMERIRNQFSKTAIQASKFAAAGAAAVAATTVSTVRAATEVSRLAQISGTSTEQFQRYAFAAKTVGIEQEKFADILKDTNDKVGDFLQTGGGPMADFFEKIAPQVGITADQFRGLSSADALGLYVKALEDANVGQQEMTFFMEAIANDSTALLPLLRNNAKGFREIGKSAAIFDEKTLEDADRMRATMMLLNENLTQIKNNIASDLLPIITVLAGAMSSSGEDAVGASKNYLKASKALVLIARTGVGAASVFELVGKALAGGAAIIAASFDDDVEHFKQVQREFIKDFRLTADEYANMIRDLDKAGEGLVSGSSIDERVETMAEMMKRAREQAAGLLSGSSGLTSINQELGIVEIKTSNVSKNIDEWLSKQEAYSNLLTSLRTTEEAITETLRERLSIIDQSDTGFFGGQDEAKRRAAAAAFQPAPQFGGIDAAIGGPASEFGRINEAETQLNEWYAKQLSMLEQFRSERTDMLGVWNEQEALLTEQHQQRLGKIEQSRQLVTLNATETLFGSMADITKQFAGEQSAAYRVLFAVEKAAAIARSIVAIQTGMAQASAAPWPQNVAAIASVASATAGIISTITSTTLQGQAHDGLMSVPRTGTYLLEQGERVTTAETSAKLDRTLDAVMAGSARGNISINNYVGEREFASMMASRAGEQVLNNWLRENQHMVKQLASA